jgi:hypothetical protein
MVSSVLVAYRVELYAWDEWDSLCSYWESNYDCHCTDRSEWKPKISCDFSQEEEGWQYLFLLLDADAYPACESMCGSLDYKLYLYEQMFGYPCYEWACEQYADECFYTWSQYSSQGSESDSWAKCSCRSYFFCPQR